VEGFLNYRLSELFCIAGNQVVFSPLLFNRESNVESVRDNNITLKGEMCTKDLMI